MPRQKKPGTSTQSSWMSDLSKMPVHTEPRCHICQSASRPKVDKLIAAQFADASIAEELVLSDEAFMGKQVDTVRKNVERHRKNHLDIKSKAIREIVERRAKEQGILLETATGQITSGRALLDLIINRATEQIVDPESKVKYADAIEAVKMLEDVQRAEYMAQLEAMERQVAAIAQAVKELVPPTMLPSIIDRAKILFEQPELAFEGETGGLKRSRSAIPEVVEGEVIQ